MSLRSSKNTFPHQQQHQQQLGPLLDLTAIAAGKNNPHLLRHLLLSLPPVPVPPYPAVVELVERLSAEQGGGVARGAEGRGRSQARDDAVGGAVSGKR